jgi:hypothetical protein
VGTDYRVAFLENFVYGDECLERLDFVSEDGLYFEAGPYRCRRVVIPGIDDTFCIDDWKNRQRLLMKPRQINLVHTTDVFLFRGGFLWRSSLFYVEG